MTENKRSARSLIDNKSGGHLRAFRSQFPAALLLSALAVLCAGVLVRAWAEGGQARFRQPNQEYAARRAKLRAQVDGPIVLYGYTGQEDASEVAVFFQENNFYYLTGHAEPGAVVVIAPEQPPEGQGVAAEVLYLPPRNKNPHDTSSELWEGPKIGPDDSGVQEETGFATVESIANLKGDLAKLAERYKSFYTIVPPEKEQGYPHFTDSMAALRALVPQAKIKDIGPQLYAMRQVKSAGELELMRKAVDASIDAHFAAMKMMRPGLFEYQVAARMKEVHEWAGCAREAYAPIVGAGFNSTVLHYGVLNDEIKDGDVVVMDVGGEYGGYAADITRTLPANGKFTPRQREIYDLVLGAQNAALAATKPGATITGRKDSLQQIVIDYFNTHPDSHGNVLTKYYPHGVSHHIGLDVHDPGDRTRPLEPGMVISMEPGLYIPEEKIGVRIEDDVLITKDGYELLTGRLPRSPDEIEKIMAGARTQPSPAP
jgi:Xaa-Pro aminopeptidase